jgi:hypothetical protein
VLNKTLAVPRQLTSAPMGIFAIRIEGALNVAGQRSHDANARVGPPGVATKISASIAASHSAASCSAFGSLVM